MPEFLVNKDMFGRYCRIPTGTSGDMHTYKIVSRIDSNGYCDMPLTAQSTKTLHTQIVPVLLVIHCGVDESKVQRVALSDCEIIPADVAEVKHGKWMDNRNGTFTCSVCGGKASKMDYCGNCGARMDGDRE